MVLGDHREAVQKELRERFPRALWNEDCDHAPLLQAVLENIDAPEINPQLPLDVCGTLFQQKVWDALRAIPAGTTISYGELANQLGHPSGARAVARACAQNPVAVIVPCHRVQRNNGDLGGYRWGIERKQALLERESH